MKIHTGINRHHVLQRRGSKGAKISLEGFCKSEGPIEACISVKEKVLPHFHQLECGKARNGSFQAELDYIPVGGPYCLTLTCGKESVRVQPFYCGDVWVLAGQSNMEGVGNCSGAAKPHPLIKAISMRRTWRAAVEPLHVLAESPDTCHNGGQQCSPQASEGLRQSTRKGVGPGLFFAREMLEHNAVPQGLICSAHGGTAPMYTLIFSSVHFWESVIFPRLMMRIYAACSSPVLST